MVVSPEFPVFSIDTSLILPEILDIYFRTPSVWPELAGISGGTNVRRRRLQPSAFLNYEMPVPPMSAQLKIREMHRRIQQLKTSHKAIREANQAIIPATLERLFSTGSS
jgi:type I restriction enzyme S subunit